MSTGKRLSTTVIVERTGSTNEDLRRILAAEPAGQTGPAKQAGPTTPADPAETAGTHWPHMSALRARHQHSGRGRDGHEWVTPPGTALTISFVLRPRVPAERLAWLPLVAGLAVRDTVAQALGDAAAPWRARTKWPNDVLLEPAPAPAQPAPTAPPAAEPSASRPSPTTPSQALTDVPGWGTRRKIAGLLAEFVTPGQGRSPGQGGAAPTVVLGIGLNAAQDPTDLPVPWATSLLAAGIPPHLAGPDSLTPVLAAALAARLEEWERADGDPDAGDGRLGVELRAACATLGEEIEATLPGGQVLQGRAVGMEPGLVIEDRNRRRTVLAAGEVRAVRQA